MLTRPRKVEHYKTKDLFSYIKLGKEMLTFGNVEIEKDEFYHHKGPVLLKNVDIEKVLVSNKVSFGGINYKYFIGYLYNHHVILLKTSAYVKSYDGQTKRMYFFIEDDDFLKKINTVWDKVSADIKKEFDSEPVYNNFFSIIMMIIFYKLTIRH